MLFAFVFVKNFLCNTIAKSELKFCLHLCNYAQQITKCLSKCIHSQTGFKSLSHTFKTSVQSLGKLYILRYAACIRMQQESATANLHIKLDKVHSTSGRKTTIYEIQCISIYKQQLAAILISAILNLVTYKPSFYMTLRYNTSTTITKSHMQYHYNTPGLYILGLYVQTCISISR